MPIIYEENDSSTQIKSQSRVEALLNEIIENGGGGDDYSTLVDAIVRKMTPDYDNAEPVVDLRSGYVIYTATKRCIMNLMIASVIRHYHTIYVNGKMVAFDASWAAAGYAQAPMINAIWLPLRAGDVVAFDNSSAQRLSNESWARYIIIPYME